MLSPQAVYPVMLEWLQELDLSARPAAVEAVAQLVGALLCAQSLRPSALMRALLSPMAVPARQRYKRVARAWDRPWLTSGWLTPRLVRAVVALLPVRGLTHLALDSVRCGPWEVIVVGVVWHGRVLPLAWTVLPYPWPPGRMGPAVTALLRQVAACWPAERPVHLVADRAFPGQRLFRTLRALGWGWTVRLRANTGVQVGEQPVLLRTLLDQASPTGWTCWAGSYGRGRTALPAHLVIGRGLVVLPRHRRTLASHRQQAERRQIRLRSRRYEYAVDATDAWVALCTTHGTWRAAVGSYRQRWAIEGSFRDAQSGWDGQHGWDLEPVLTQTPSAGQAERIVGLWALGYLVQAWLGSQIVHGPPAVRAVARGWTTTGRLSIWAQGQCALREPLLTAWLDQTLHQGATRLYAPHHARPSPASTRAA
jgi:Transposase DDE domain